MHVGYPNVTEDYKKNIKRELNVQKNTKKNNNYPVEKIGQSVGASWWMVCYQRGYPFWFLK